MELTAWPWLLALQLSSQLCRLTLAAAIYSPYEQVGTDLNSYSEDNSQEYPYTDGNYIARNEDQPEDHTTDQSDPDGYAQEFLKAHNLVRQEYSTKPLKWDQKLANQAKLMTSKCVFEHTLNNEHGENLAAGPTTPKEVVSYWVNGSDEKSAFNPSSGYSHFTQVLWKGTSMVGCAYTVCDKLEGTSLTNVQFHACEYDPPGNVMGQNAENVNALPGGAPKND